MKLYWREKTQSILALIGEEIWVDMRSGDIISEPSGTIARLNAMSGEIVIKKFQKVNFRLFKNWRKVENGYLLDDLYLMIEKTEDGYTVAGKFPKYFFKALNKIMPC